MSPMMNEICYSISAALLGMCVVYYIYNVIMAQKAAKKVLELQDQLNRAIVDEIFEEAEEKFSNPDVIDVDFVERKKAYRNVREMALDELSRQKLALDPKSMRWRRGRQID
jgi:hypothetical protein